MMTAHIKTVLQGFLDSHFFPTLRDVLLSFLKTVCTMNLLQEVVLLPEAEYFQLKTDKVSLETFS